MLNEMGGRAAGFDRDLLCELRATAGQRSAALLRRRFARHLHRPTCGGRGGGGGDGGNPAAMAHRPGKTKLAHCGATLRGTDESIPLIASPVRAKGYGENGVTHD